MITNLLNKDEIPLYEDFSQARNVDHDQIEGTQLTKTIFNPDEPKPLSMKFRAAVLRIMKNVNKIKRSANTRFRLLDIVSKYKNFKTADGEDDKEEEKKDEEK